MKKILFILIFALFNFIFLYGECICYYSNEYNCCKKSCEYIARLIQGGCYYKSILSEETIKAAKDITIFIGFGSNLGMFKPNVSHKVLSYDKVISWNSIAKLKTKLLIVDSCFAGYLLDYKTNADIVVTGVGKENEWIVKDLYGNYVSCFAVALNCMYNKDYQCPVNCKNDSFNICQFKINLWNIYKNFNDFDINFMFFYNWEYPSIGTMNIKINR